MSIFPAKSENPAFPTEGDGTYNEIFRKISLDKVPAPAAGYVLTINSNMSVAEAARVLSENKILSAPVRDVSQPDNAPWSSKYSGVIDFLAIVNWLMDSTWGHAPTNFEELRNLKQSFNDTPVSEILAHARASPFIPIDPVENTFLDANILLGKYGVRRVFAVTGAHGDIRTVVSQSSVVEIIGNNLESFAHLVSKPISTLGLGLPLKVVSVNLDNTYWDAFKLISKHLVNSVAIVDKKGELVGNVSSRDLRRMILEPAQFATMAKPIGEFFTRGLELFTVHDTDTLESVVRKFQSSRVHALYVLNADKQPISVISLRDVIAQFVRESEEDAPMFQSFFESRPL